METRLRQEQKKSKQAKADRIVNSLKMKASLLSPVTRKIKKKRRTRQAPLHYLTYETQNGKKKKVCFIFTRSSRKNSGPKYSAQRAVESTHVPKKTAPVNISQVGYGDLLFSAYEDLKKKSESNLKIVDQSSTNNKSSVKGMSMNTSDNFAGIEYDPKDNYFYLVGNDPSDKMALFENQGVKAKKMLVNNFVINPALLKNLKQDFQLEGLFQ
jgi:hypothetical protein